MKLCLKSYLPLYSYGLLGTAKMFICMNAGLPCPLNHQPHKQGQGSPACLQTQIQCVDSPHIFTRLLSKLLLGSLISFRLLFLFLLTPSCTLSHPGLTVVVGGDMLPTHHQEVGLRVNPQHPCHHHFHHFLHCIHTSQT